MPFSERRRFPRFAGKLNVRFYVDDRLIEGETRDLSMSGAYILSAPIPLTNRVLVLKVFPGYGQQAVTIEARVARTLEDGFGVEWMQASAPITASPLRAFIHDVLGITQGFVKRLDDANGVPRFVYKFSYDALTRGLQATADPPGEVEVVEGETRLTDTSRIPVPVAGAIPVLFATKAQKVRARMIGGYENGLVLQAEGEPVANFDRLDIHVYPDDRKRRIDLKGLVSRVKPLDKGYKVYIRLTLDNDQPALSRFRVLAEALRAP